MEHIESDICWPWALNISVATVAAPEKAPSLAPSFCSTGVYFRTYTTSDNGAQNVYQTKDDW